MAGKCRNPGRGLRQSVRRLVRRRRLPVVGSHPAEESGTARGVLEKDGLVDDQGSIAMEIAAKVTQWCPAL